MTVVHQNIERYADEEATIEALARFVVERSDEAIQHRGTFRLALSGGSTPVRLYRRLTLRDLAGQVDWGRTHLFFGDERCVGPGDPASNFRMAREALIDHVPIPPDNVHAIDGDLPASRAAAAYAEVLDDVPLDVVLLGMGGDGHTASLFPDTPGMSDERHPVLATRSPLPPHQRVSLSIATINSARIVAFLVLGADKTLPVAEVARQLRLAVSAATLPAAWVRPAPGRLLWFVDGQAAAHLETKVSQ